MKTETVDFTPNIWNRSVEIEASIFNGYKNYIEYMEISLDDYELEKHNQYKFSYRIKTSQNDSLARWTGRDRAVSYLYEENVRLAELMIINMVEIKIPALIEKGKSTLAWKLISTEAEELNQPLHFKRDLFYHDALTLGIFNLKKFLWIIRDTGTWLFGTWNGMDDNFARAAIKSDSHDNTARVFLFENDQLKQIEFYDGWIKFDQLIGED